MFLFFAENTSIGVFDFRSSSCVRDISPPGNAALAFFCFSFLVQLCFCSPLPYRTLPTRHNPSRCFVCVDVSLELLDWCLLRPAASTPVCIAATADLGLAAPAQSHPGFPPSSALLPDKPPSRLNRQLSSGPPSALTTSWRLWFHCEVEGKALSLRLHGISSQWNSPGQNTGVGSLSLLQGIFPSQGSNPGLLHCKRILYQLSQQGSH